MQRCPIPALTFACACACALVAAPQFATAGEPPRNDPAAAQALFYEARSLMKQGRYAEACPKFEESLRLDHGIGTEFNLADCHEHVGKVASAWTGFLSVAALAKTKEQKDREKAARQRAHALERRLPKLLVEVKDPPPGLEVRRDGVVLGSAAFGTSIPVDPGPHKVVATAPGKAPWETTVDAAEGQTSKVTIPRALPEATTAVATAAPAAPVVAAAPVTEPAPAAPTTTASTYFPEPIDERESSGRRTAGFVVAGAGLIGLGVGGYFGLASLSRRNDSRDHCQGNVCDAEGVSLRKEAIEAGNVSTVASIAGGAALLGGLVLVFTAPSDTKTTGKSFRAAPTLASSGAGFTFGGPLP